MSKRKLTRQQQHRIQKVQDERLTRARKKDEKIDSKLEGGELGEARPGLIIAHYGITTEVEG